MMAQRIELLFDFVSPNAYLIWQPLRDLAERAGARLDVTAVFLAGMHRLTGNAPPMIRDAEVKGKNEYAALEMRRFIARHGLTRFRMHPQFPFNSITLQRMLFAAGEDGRGAAFVDTMLPAIWEEGLDLTDHEQVAGAIAAGGFDAGDLLARAATSKVKDGLAANTDEAVARGAFGIPTVFVESGADAGTSAPRMFFGKERLGQIDEALAGK